MEFGTDEEVYGYGGYAPEGADMDWGGLITTVANVGSQAWGGYGQYQAMQQAEDRLRMERQAAAAALAAANANYVAQQQAYALAQQQAADRATAEQAAADRAAALRASAVATAPGAYPTAYPAATSALSGIPVWAYVLGGVGLLGIFVVVLRPRGR